ncbi:MAG TPA: hypothetical protein VFV27_11985 [Nevskiaceae bacterium]|nr:hypothetical protein [Nevskiaceae bacterium]
MQTPDFALPPAPHFAPADLLFLFEHFPAPGVDAVAAVQRVHEQPLWLERILDSRYVLEALQDRRQLLLSVSPQLFFDVALRHSLDPLAASRSPVERLTIHYLAHLLALFIRSERWHQASPDDPERYAYLADLMQAAQQAELSRRFLYDAHLANYALCCSGLFARWMTHRRVYHRRPVSIEYYRRLGRTHFGLAASHGLAARYQLHEVFRHLEARFEYFRDGLDRLAQRFLPQAAAA